LGWKESRQLDRQHDARRASIVTPSGVAAEMSQRFAREKIFYAQGHPHRIGKSLGPPPVMHTGHVPHDGHAAISNTP
jgi:hypothetical protein